MLSYRISYSDDLLMYTYRKHFSDIGFKARTIHLKIGRFFFVSVYKRNATHGIKTISDKTYCVLTAQTESGVAIHVYGTPVTSYPYITREIAYSSYVLPYVVDIVVIVWYLYIPRIILKVGCIWQKKRNKVQ